MAFGLEPGMTVPTILRLKIDRFPGLNLILGGGDVGNQTVIGPCLRT
jgi:hypothetical protein